jgi:hypothetical protein
VDLEVEDNPMAMIGGDDEEEEEDAMEGKGSDEEEVRVCVRV